MENIKYKVLIDKTKKNIIEWYPFEKDAKVLEISIEGFFIEELKDKVKTLMFTKNINEINEKDFDYIILLGELPKLENQLNKIIEKLNEKGKMIIITNNKLSIKQRVTLNKNIEENYNKKKIEEILTKYNMANFKFYYILPDYKATNVIFTDKHLPDIETISRNITFYKSDDILINTENKLFLELINEDVKIFKNFANSFFIECSKNKFEDNKIEFVSFSNMRKEKYSIKTIIQGENVYKTANNKTAQKHIEQIKSNIDILKNNNFKTLDIYNENEIISKYQKEEETLDKMLIKEINNNNINKVKELIEKFYNELKMKLEKTENSDNVLDKYKIPYEKKEIENLTFVKYGLWDMIFQNAFYINEKFFFYDQEWIEPNIPLEYILYRSIEYSQGFKELIDIKQIYIDFGINEDNKNIFRKLDNILQEEIRSELSWSLHSNFMSFEKLKEKEKQEIDNYKRKNEELKQENENKHQLLNQKDARINFLEKNIKETCEILKEKEDKIINMENSKSWKITKPLRALRSGNNKKY